MIRVRVKVLVFWVLSFGSCLLGLVFWVLSFGSCLLGLVFWVLSFGSCLLGVIYLILFDIVININLIIFLIFYYNN
jgi:hypothetical protein